MCAFPFYHYRGKGTEPRKHGVKDKDGSILRNKDEDEEKIEDELEVRSSKLHSDLAYVQLHPEVRYDPISKTSIYFSHLIDMIRNLLHHLVIHSLNSFSSSHDYIIIFMLLFSFVIVL